ncbi:MAG: hypothetical protein M3619_30880, partial [Myxococcota bacterium]|nr:hypothetical protein [Myxococcota bacterium]
SDELTEQLRDLERRAKLAEEAARAGADAEQRVQAAQAIIVEAERRAREAEARARDAEAQLASAELHVDGAEAYERQLFDAQNRITELEDEVAKAENVRSFAAETEREIAQLQRDLREARAKLTQTTLERDRLAADLRNARDDSETTNRRAPFDRNAGPGPASGSSKPYDPEITAQADLSKYEPIIAKANELQGRVAELEREDVALRRRLADAEQRLRDTIDGGDDDGVEPTHTSAQLPIAFAEHLGILEESIDSLRANMRAASDETAMMDQTDSVVAVSSAVSQAAEHVERARAAIRAMNASIGIG